MALYYLRQPTVNGFLVLSQLLRGPLLMEQSAAEGYLPLLEQLMRGESVGAAFKGKKSKNAPYAVAFSALDASAKVHQATKYNSFDEAPMGSVAVIPVMGPMMQQDFCGSLGTQSLARLTQEADNHPNISALVHVFDTPGGTVAGTEHFSNAIKGTQKPCVAYVQGMMASAGYWSGSSANHVMLNGQTAQVGSIGTMIEVRNTDKAQKKNGVKSIVARADASKDKNEAYYQLLQGNDGPMKAQMLNPLNDVFVGAVKANRGNKLQAEQDGVLSGMVFLSAQAIEYGLADSIGTFDDAVQLALQLAETQNNNDSNSPNSTSMFKVKAAWGAMIAALGLSATAAADTQLTEANLDELNAKMQETQDALATATTALSAKETALATATTALSAKETELATAAATITDLTAKVAEYGTQAGAVPTQPVKAEGSDALPTPAEAIADPNSGHMRLAASYGL